MALFLSENDVKQVLTATMALEAVESAHRDLAAGLAQAAGVKAGDTVAVVGDGAVGLSAVMGARKLGATRIIALSRNPARQAVAKEFGATDIVEERGDDAVQAVLRLTDGGGVDAALECVGTDQSIETCAGITRAGGMIGAVGVPLYEKFEYKTLFWKNIGIKGGVAPARQYIPEVADAYAAMDERRAIKSLLTVSNP